MQGPGAGGENWAYGIRHFMNFSSPAFYNNGTYHADIKALAQ